MKRSYNVLTAIIRSKKMSPMRQRLPQTGMGGNLFLRKWILTSKQNLGLKNRDDGVQQIVRRNPYILQYSKEKAIKKNKDIIGRFI
jgi:hypothetical protein